MTYRLRADVSYLPPLWSAALLLARRPPSPSSQVRRLIRKRTSSINRRYFSNFRASKERSISSTRARASSFSRPDAPGITFTRSCCAGSLRSQSSGRSRRSLRHISSSDGSGSRRDDRTEGAALSVIRAVRALAHRGLVRRSRYFRAEHHLREAAVIAIDRTRRLQRTLGGSQVCAQFHEFPVRARPCVHRRDLHQGQHPRQDRHRVVQAGRRVHQVEARAGGPVQRRREAGVLGRAGRRRRSRPSPAICCCSRSTSPTSLGCRSRRSCTASSPSFSSP